MHSIKMVILLGILLLGSALIVAQEVTGTVTVASLRVRTGPGTDYADISRLNTGATVLVEGRNAIGDWLLVRTPDNAIRGWVSAGYVDLDGVSPGSLPVSEERLGNVTPPQPEPQPVTTAPTAATNGKIITRINVRVGPSTTYPRINQLGGNTRVVMEARNAIGDWVILHTRDNVLRGWVASRFVAFDEGWTLNDLPISDEILPIQNGRAASETEEVAYQDSEVMRARLESIPLLYNMLSSRVYRTFYYGRELGNRPDVFMKVGDSVTASQPFLESFSGGHYNLGGYPELEEMIQFFRVSPREGVPDSFVNKGYTAVTGFTSAAVMDAMWSPPSCNGLVPLHCEYEEIRPAVAIILFGPQDLGFNSASTFAFEMDAIVQDLLNLGVIPILNTFAAHPDFRWNESLLYNTIILDIAEQYNVPLINLFRATQPLPDYGVGPDKYHLSNTWNDDNFNFAGGQDLYGVAMRNLLTMLALDQLYRSLLRG